MDIAGREAEFIFGFGDGLCGCGYGADSDSAQWAERFQLMKTFGNAALEPLTIYETQSRIVRDHLRENADILEKMSKIMLRYGKVKGKVFDSLLKEIKPTEAIRLYIKEGGL